MSDQDNTIFESKSSETPEAKDTSDNNDPATLLASIKAEDGRQKYATVQDAIGALKHSQSHIATIQQENAALKAEVEKRKAMEDVLAQLKATDQDSDQTPEPRKDSPPAASKDTVENVVKAMLQKAEAEKASKENTAKVVTALTTKFGDQAKAKFIEVAQNSGVSVDYLNNLAATAPQAVLRLAGIDSPQAPRVPGQSSGSVNPEAMKPAEPQRSAKVPHGANSKQMVEAWRNARVSEAS